MNRRTVLGLGIALVAVALAGAVAVLIMNTRSPGDRRYDGAGVAVADSPAAGAVGAGSSVAPGSPGAGSSGASGGLSPGGSTDAPSASGSASAGPSIVPTPSPLPSLVPAPLDGLLVAPALAARHPVAVMIDDLGPARPQSGFTAASVVWQAPAEGGIPRYMLVFQENVPGAVGPVRSARYYFIAWAAEWRAAYAHAGGSPQALQTLAAQGHGQLVYNVDQFRYSATYFWRITTRFAPHNLYTDGKRLNELAAAVGATAPPPGASWTFAPDAPLAQRPTGGHIQVSYPANRIDYAYDRKSNTYLRSVSWGQAQIDPDTGKRVAPKNVIVMFMQFGALNDGHPAKGRLEAKIIGTGLAYIATNGRTIAGRWIKTSLTGPTRFVDRAGHDIPLTAGQTFVQVMPVGAPYLIQDGKLPAPGVQGEGHL